ncbi:MAG: nicotinamide riboside transporter PnuC [Flavobacteriales bacterium]
MSPELALVLEWTAVVLNIFFTVFIALEKRLGWLFGFVASVISIVLYQAQDAWLMALLNVFYAIMGIYGWWAWGSATEEKPITRFHWPRHLVLLAIGGAATVLLVWSMKHYQVPGTYQGMEAFIASFAIIATWLMSAKALENWIYWTIGDVVAVVFNFLIGFNGYALLNLVYIGLAVAGYIRWNRAYNAQLKPAPIA